VMKLIQIELVMFKMFFIVLLIVAFTPLKEAQAEFVDVVAKVKPSVVGIGIHTPTSRPQNILRGTGFVIGDGHYVVTNAHVLPTEFTSELYDLAILKLSGSALPALTLADEKFRGDGTYVAFTGFPIGTVLGLYPVTHRGIIASTTPTVVPAQAAEQINLKMLKRMRNPYLAYQLDATAYPGNSGSAMYDMKTGEVLGVINKVFVQATKEAVISNPSGITYAIPVKYLHQILRENNIKL